MGESGIGIMGVLAGAGVVGLLGIIVVLYIR